jgi:hypothetical protein
MFLTKIELNEDSYFKISTGDFPVFTGPVDFLNRSCPVRYWFGRTGTGLPDRFQR